MALRGNISGITVGILRENPGLQDLVRIVQPGPMKIFISSTLVYVSSPVLVPWFSENRDGSRLEEINFGELSF